MGIVGRLSGPNPSEEWKPENDKPDGKLTKIVIVWTKSVIFYQFPLISKADLLYCRGIDTGKTLAILSS